MKTLIKPVANDNEVEELYSAQCDENTCYGINCECRTRCDLKCTCVFDIFDEAKQTDLLF